MLADFPTTTGQTNVWTGGSYADYFIDLGGDMSIGQDGNQSNLTYYVADQTHLTTAGGAVVASYVKNAILLFPR